MLFLSLDLLEERMVLALYPLIGLTQVSTKNKSWIKKGHIEKTYNRKNKNVDLK